MNEQLLKYISHPLVQEKWNPRNVGDRVYVTGKVGIVIGWNPMWVHLTDSMTSNLEYRKQDALWIPLPTDPLDYILNRLKEERRGVWEWIDWSKTYHTSVGVDENEKQIDIVWVTDNKTFSGDPLTTLLQVYLYQKGVEV